jgi:diguanylate cyclase (GGDEF)-like protein
MQDTAPIIIIDDDATIRYVISTALLANGLRPLEAESGEAGLRLYHEQGAAAILLDVMMPGGMNGYETCAAFRNLPDGQHIPILIMTGHEDIDSVNHAFQAGATDFITKPINFPLLSHRVKYMLRSNQTTQQLVVSKKRLHRLAYFDTLTDLPNRLFFKEYLEHIVTLAQRKKFTLAVLFLDLDGFKRINDTLGHHVGDQVLKTTSERLRNSIRACDAFTQTGATKEGFSLARLGGDEFTVLLSVIERNEDASVVAERIRVNLSQPIIIDNNELVTTTSIGICIFPDDCNSPDDLLKNADLAMYHAKRGGGNRYHYFSVEMTKIALRKLNLENYLRKAIERGELELHYQPKLSLATGKYTSIEALLRWQSSKLGAVSPDEFIPFAEETGLIVNIGDWALSKACAQTQSWRASGIHIGSIAVNISVTQLLRPGFSDRVEEILCETGLEAEALELEITESALIKEELLVFGVLQKLKQIGVQLAIDDFGTGYSSLGRLKNFPIDRLKIDKVFICNLERDTTNEAIAAAVIAMAESMGMQVTAEGVETETQLAFLHSKRCNEAQGLLLSKPLTATEAEEFLRSNT